MNFDEPAVPAYPPVIEPRARKDAYPEDVEYRDTGCRLHSSCLTCPLAVCLYDAPGATHRLINRASDVEVLRLRAEGLTVTEVAKRLGLSRRTVFRISANAKASNHPAAASAEGLAGLNKWPSMPHSPVQGQAASRARR